MTGGSWQPVGALALASPPGAPPLGGLGGTWPHLQVGTAGQPHLARFAQPAAAPWGQAGLSCF